MKLSAECFLTYESEDILGGTVSINNHDTCTRNYLKEQLIAKVQEVIEAEQCGKLNEDSWGYRTKLRFEFKKLPFSASRTHWFAEGRKLQGSLIFPCNRIK